MSDEAVKARGSRRTIEGIWIGGKVVVLAVGMGTHPTVKMVLSKSDARALRRVLSELLDGPAEVESHGD